MPDALTVLLGQNVPRAIAGWLHARRPHWTIVHTSDVALSGRPDEELFVWAQQQHAIIVTFDEDFLTYARSPSARMPASSDYACGPRPSKKRKTPSCGCSPKCPTPS